MTPGQQALVGAAGFLAGGINGIAGGGSLVSFPSLLAVGQPALTANVTSTVGIWPGYLGGVFGFRREIADQGDRVRSLLPAALLGAAAGAGLLLTTSPTAFEALTPFLILLASALFAAQPVLGRRVAARAEADEAADAAQAAAADEPAPSGRPAHRRIAAQASTFLSAVYGAYFGAGLGVVLLAVLGTLLPDRLVRTNGLRGVFSLVINTVAAAIFMAQAPVAWGAAGLLAGGSLVGGYAGARVARRVPALLIRAFVIVVGVVAAGRLLLF